MLKEFGSFMNFFLVSDPEFEWDELVAWGLAHLKGKSFKSVCVNWLGGLPSTIYGSKGTPLCMLAQSGVRNKV